MHEAGARPARTQGLVERREREFAVVGRAVTPGKTSTRLEAENAKLRLTCDVQKRVSLLLGVTLPKLPDDDESSGSSS